MMDWANEGVDLNSQLLAAINDNLQNLIYGLGNRKGPKPKPTDLTGEARKRDTVSFKEQDGSPIEGVSVEEMKARLGITDI